MNAAVLVFPWLQAVRRGRWMAIVATVIGLAAVPLAGGAVMKRALLASGYTECRTMGWLERGLWAAPGHGCE